MCGVGYLYETFDSTVKVVQVCSEMIQAEEFPIPTSMAALSRQKVNLNDGQRVHQVTLHHQIRQDDVPQVRSASVPSRPVSLLMMTFHRYAQRQYHLDWSAS